MLLHFFGDESAGGSASPTHFPRRSPLFHFSLGFWDPPTSIPNHPLISHENRSKYQPTGAPGHVFALKISCSLLCHAPSWHILLRNAAPWAYHDGMTILQVNFWDSKCSSFNWIFWGWRHHQQRCHHPPWFTFSHPKVHAKPLNNQGLMVPQKATWWASFAKCVKNCLTYFSRNLAIKLL